FSCGDAGGSGLASCTSTVGSSGSPIDTSTGGVKSFTVLAADHAGNETSQRVGYVVIAQATEPAGGTLSSGSSVSVDDPLATSVTTPSAGMVTIAESPAPSAPPPTGYSFFGQQADITAPVATTSAPLVITFLVERTVLSGTDPRAITVFRDGAPIADFSASSGSSGTPDTFLLQTAT